MVVAFALAAIWNEKSACPPFGHGQSLLTRR
jgi:hypothetical protein